MLHSSTASILLSSGEVCGVNERKCLQNYSTWKTHNIVVLEGYKTEQNLTQKWKTTRTSTTLLYSQHGKITSFKWLETEKAWR